MELPAQRSIKARFEQAAPALLILLAVLAAFGSTLAIGFIWDDHRFIEANIYIRNWNLANLKQAFLSDPFNQSLNYYRPLQTLSNMVDFSVWRLNPFGYHLTNLVFHAAGALLVLVLASELGLGRPAAFLAALFFAVNPAGVEQLIVVAGRAELASSAFALASLLAFLRKRYTLSFLSFLAALGFKENGAVVPLLTALALWYAGKDGREYLKLLPFMLVLPFYLWLRHAATGAGPLEHGAALILALAAKKLPVAVLLYVKNALLPLKMHSHRMQPDFSAWYWAAYAAWAAALAALARYKPRAALFLLGWYLANLAPKVPLLASGDLMLEHWSYLANLSLYAAAAVLAARGLESGGFKRTVSILCAGALALFWIAAANANIRLRSTDLKLYEHAAAYSNSKPLLYNLAREYYLAGRYEKSRVLFARVSGQAPGNPQYLNGLALSLWKTGDKAGAARTLDRLLAGRPDNAEALVSRAYLFIESGSFAEAKRLLERSIAAAPGNVTAYSALAGLRLRDGDANGVLAVYAALLGLDPRNREALTNSGVILASTGRYAEAAAFFEKALELSPGSPEAAMNLARARKLRDGGKP